MVRYVKIGQSTFDDFVAWFDDFSDWGNLTG
jgi:hypothetical protein